MRKTRKYATGLNLVPISDVTNNGYESPRVLAQRLRQEEAAEQQAAQKAAEEKLLAPVREVEAQVRIAAREHSAKAAKFWRLPVASIEDYIRYSDEVVDDRLDLPTTETPISNEEFCEVVKTFVESLPSRGVELTTQDSRRRFALFACSQRDSRRAVIDDATLTAILERCLALKIFGSEVTGELARAAQPDPAEPPSEPTIDDLLALDTTTREGFKEAQKLAHDLGQIELAPVFQAWSQSLADNFSIYTTEEDRQRITAWFTRNNRRDKRAFDDCRKFMVRQGFWPESALTKEEIIARDWEARPERSDTFESKQELRRQLDHFGTKVLG